MKEHDKNNWESKIRERLKDMEEAPDDKLWAGIEENIRPVSYRPLSVAAAVLFLLLGLGGVLLYTSGDEHKPENSAVDSTIQEKGREEKNTPSAGIAKESEQEGKTKKEPDGNSGAEANDSRTYKKKNPEADQPLSAAKIELAPLNPVSEPKRIQKADSGQAKSGFVGTDKNSSPTYTKENQAISPAASEPGVFGQKQGSAGAESAQNSWPEVSKKTPVYYLQDESIVRLPQEFKVLQAPAAEEEIIEPKKHPRHQKEFWGTFNPMLTYRQVNPNQKDDIEITALRNDSPFSLNRAGVQTSAGVSFFVTPRLAIKAGAFYRYTQNKWSYHYLEAYPDSVVLSAAEGGMMKVEPFQEVKVREISEKNNELGMLFGLQYSAGTSFRRNVNLDFLAAKNLASGQLLYYLAFDVDIERRLGENIFLYAGPSFMWGLNSDSSAAYQSFELKPYSLGLKLGISYRIGRE